MIPCEIIVKGESKGKPRASGDDPAAAMATTDAWP